VSAFRQISRTFHDFPGKLGHHGLVDCLQGAHSGEAFMYISGARDIAFCDRPTVASSFTAHKRLSPCRIVFSVCLDTLAEEKRPVRDKKPAVPAQIESRGTFRSRGPRRTSSHPRDGLRTFIEAGNIGWAHKHQTTHRPGRHIADLHPRPCSYCPANRDRLMSTGSRSRWITRAR